MLIDESPTQTFVSTLTITNFTPASSAQVYRYSASNLNSIVHLPDQTVTSSGSTVAFPAQSITLFIIPPSVPLDKHVYLPLVIK